ncbi:D-amino acid dehydrogenase [Thermomonas sp.]|uniref:D-amino acid dehydrogenase n=1 Tax=Thermomonas sp. TaxID=1971895 RepID=UPI00248A50B0|nr:D-amino acid dehydrogenase [Thermomonas sp.]MDI1251600.1 D-amino acid dehydrogenase [Thermomonas sp.]
MKTVILGAGIVGVTTAYYLAKSGREVTVIDRQPSVARETSYANAGLVAPGHSYTWASPKAPKILFKSLFQDGQALRLRLNADPRMWAWGLQFLRNCTAERSRLNTTRKLHLCVYSQRKLQELTASEGLQYDRIEGGLLYLYRDQASFAKGCSAMTVLSDNGLSLQILTPDEVALREPTLAASKHRIAGAIFCPTDESGDAHLFSQDLERRCRALGVRFELDRQIQGFSHAGNRVDAVLTDKGQVKGDDFVLALGSYSPLLASKLGYRLSVYPVKGYSVTLPVHAHHRPPTMGGVDENNLVAWARFGDRLRFTATAEFAGYDTSYRPSDFVHMLQAARDLFPEGADYDKPTYWSCLRPMTPAGAPILGKTGHSNFYLNTGHGHMGWTMACGTSQILVDIMNGHTPDLDLQGLTL